MGRRSQDLSESRPRRNRAAAVVAGMLLFSGFMGLGVWQLQRLAWKLDLIARVDARIHAAPAAPPGPETWAWISKKGDEYRRVRIGGVFDNDRETLVQAVTEAGPGFWVMTPLKTDRGYVVLVNRGFVPPEMRPQGSRGAGLPAGEVAVTGLLRMTEPNGGFLRANQPAAGRWYSRDVAEIGRARGLSPVAPYFIDADATPNPGGWPRGGMTVVHFRNAHLAYALTWFGMAGITALWGAWAIIEGARARRRFLGAGFARLHRQPS
ncbi:MAG TPA: SURF1 family protein [Phenylobacterium sp.]|jgi:surfeit locus 1 family protein|nr:SURF1 family protein [Phenylobacterium sp.]